MMANLPISENHGLRRRNIAPRPHGRDTLTDIASTIANLDQLTLKTYEDLESDLDTYTKYHEGCGDSYREESRRHMLQVTKSLNSERQQSPGVKITLARIAEIIEEPLGSNLILPYLKDESILKYWRETFNQLKSLLMLPLFPLDVLRDRFIRMSNIIDRVFELLKKAREQERLDYDILALFGKRYGYVYDTCESLRHHYFITRRPSLEEFQRLRPSFRHWSIEEYHHNLFPRPKEPLQEPEVFVPDITPEPQHPGPSLRWVWATFVVTVVANNVFFAIGYNYSAHEHGGVRDADFWFLLSAFALQILGLLMSSVSLVNVVSKRVWMPPTISSLACIVVAVLLYPFAPKEWSSFFMLIGESVQVYMQVLLARSFGQGQKWKVY